MRKKKSDMRAVDSAWAMFEKTGSVSYYMLYKKLSEKD